MYNGNILDLKMNIFFSRNELDIFKSGFIF